MADHIEYSVSVRPIEELSKEIADGSIKRIVASEVGRTLGGKSTSIDLADFSGALTVQGFKDGAVGYRDAPHEVVGARLNTGSAGDFFSIKNTGFKYSSATVLGIATTDCVLVAIRLPAQSSASNGGWVLADDTPQIHYIELGWLKPGGMMPIPLTAYNQSMTQFGAVAGDLTALNDNSGADGESAFIYIRTFQSDGSVAIDGNAVEFLAVT